MFSSDHAPYRFTESDGKQQHGSDASFDKIANGVPGLEARLPLLFSEGVGKGRITLNRFVDV
ncbi:MAG: dihydropyrimidinase, partial [Gemmatimonadetes bacterium]|nr:dihydropyrimidinase [Gemmatimonadota bacterium]